MSSPESTPSPGRPGFVRLVEVEARKQVDTRSGRWLIGVAAGLVLAVYLAGALLGKAGGFADAFAVGAIPLGVLLPVVTILGVTSEWSTGASQVTFVLEPRRGRVLAAKVVGGLLLSLGLIVVALIAAALATLVSSAARGASPMWDLGWWEWCGLTVLLLLNSAQGAALGALLQHTVASIVAFLLLPTVGTIVVTVLLGDGPVVPWVSINDAMAPLVHRAPLGSTEWAQLAAASALWILAPGALGALRWSRREIT